MQRQGSSGQLRLSFDPVSLHVLVVDDDAVSRKIVANFLRKVGYQGVVCAQDAPTALKILGGTEQAFNLILTDVHMPEVNGLQFLKILKSDNRWRELPVVMMSATEDLDIIYQCLRAGADDYLLKPVRREMVKSLWQNVWRRRRENSVMHSLTLDKQKVPSYDEHLRSLEAQIAALKGQVDEAVETPVGIIMKALRDIISANNLTPEVRTALTNILRSLSSSNLYRPAIGKMLVREDMENVARVWFSPDLLLMPRDGSGLITSSAPSLSTAPIPSKISSPRDPPAPPLPVPPIDKGHLRSWAFDVWAHSEDDLLLIVADMFREFGILERFAIPESRLLAFLREGRAGYHRQNPYHNFRHAVDVTHAVYLFLTLGEVAQHLSQLELFALLVAAFGHDLDHPGLNNNFQILTGSQLATLYNDRSVLENFHCSRLFQILKREDCNVLEGLRPFEYREFRHIVITLILGTDLNEHMDILGRLNAIMETFTYDNTDHRHLLLTILVKCADISNTARPFQIAKYWAELVQEEFFMQGEMEHERHLPVSPFMDRAKQLPLPRMQINFVEMIVLPIFVRLAQLFPPLEACLDTVRDNYQTWQALLKEMQTPPSSSSS